MPGGGAGGAPAAAGGAAAADAGESPNQLSLKNINCIIWQELHKN